MSERRKDSGKNPGKYVTRVEYRQTVSEVKMMKLALFGEDGRGGLVRDIQEIKSSLKAATSIVKSIGIPTCVAVGAALITAYFLTSIS